MVFFRLNRTAQLAAVGAALVSGPGCYQSFSDEDAGDADARDTSEVRDGVEVVDAPDAPDVSDVREDVYEPDFVVDCVPYPMCEDVPGSGIAVAAVEQAADFAVAELRLEGFDDWLYLECSSPDCLRVEPAGGFGTVSDVEFEWPDRFRFRYTNPELSTWHDPVRLDLEWLVMCYDWGSGDRLETVRGTAWACRDYENHISIVADPGSCPTIDDPLPKPMAQLEPEASPSGGLELRATANGPGEWRIRALGPAVAKVSYRWVASGGVLELRSQAEALFRPAPEAAVSMVQVAAFTPQGVTVQVFRRRRA